MICDMIVGSGWPFGGEYLKKEDQSQMVTIETIDLYGDQSYRLSIDEPAGKYVLYYVVKLTGYMAVINGAPGAAGQDILANDLTIPTPPHLPKQGLM